MMLLLLACNQEVEVTPSQTACTDVDFANPAPSTLEWEPDGDGAHVWRTYVFLDQSGLTFSPDLGIEKGVLSIHEAWTEPESDDPFCYVPEVRITAYTGTGVSAVRSASTGTRSPRATSGPATMLTTRPMPTPSRTKDSTTAVLSVRVWPLT